MKEQANNKDKDQDSKSSKTKNSITLLRGDQEFKTLLRGEIVHDDVANVRFMCMLQARGRSSGVTQNMVVKSHVSGDVVSVRFMCMSRARLYPKHDGDSAGFYESLIPWIWGGRNDIMHPQFGNADESGFSIRDLTSERIRGDFNDDEEMMNGTDITTWQHSNKFPDVSERHDSEWMK
ncbi:hypothetical protein Tco_0869332 [Tanacetum coccineum]